MLEGSDVQQTIRHSDEAEMSFICAARSDDSTKVNSTWYKLEKDSDSGEIYEVKVYNRSDKLLITGPDTTLTIKLAANDSEGWAVYGGRYLCRATNGYSSDTRLIIINVVDLPPYTRNVAHRYVNCFTYLFCIANHRVEFTTIDFLFVLNAMYLNVRVVSMLETTCMWFRQNRKYGAEIRRPLSSETFPDRSTSMNTWKLRLVLESHLRPNRKWKYGGNQKNELREHRCPLVVINCSIC